MLLEGSYYIRNTDLSGCLLSDANTQPVWVYNTINLQIEAVNAAALEIYKYSRQEFLTKNVKDLGLPEDRSLIENRISIIASDQIVTRQVKNQDSQGSIFWVQIISYPINFNGSSCRMTLVQNLQEILDFKSEVQKTTTLLQTIFDNSLDVICTLDVSGKFLQCSKASINVFGYEASYLIGKHFSQFIEPDDLEKAMDICTQIQSGALVTNFQNYYLRPDGSRVPIMWSARWNSHEQAMYCTAKDASGKLLADQKDQQYTRRITTILESITEGFFTVDKDWNITYWNKEAEKLTQLKRDLALGQNLWDLFRDARVSKFFTESHLALSENVSVHFEEYFQPLEVWLEVSAYPSDEGLSVYFKDISERKNNQALLEESNERFEIVSKATNDILWDWDLTTGKVIWSNAVKTALGYENNLECQHDNWWFNKLHPDDRERVNSEISTAIEKGGASCASNYRFLCADGSFKNIFDRGYIMKGKCGKAVRMIGSMQDITVLKQNEAKLIEKNNKISEIAFINSHEVRKHLANILGLVDLLPMADKNDMSELLGLLKSSSEELDQIVRNIADKANG